MKRRYFVLFCLLNLVPNLLWAVDPPTEVELREEGVTFERLVEVRMERERLFPEYLRDRKAGIQSKLTEVVHWLKPLPSGNPAVTILKNVITKNEGFGSWLKSSVGRGDFSVWKENLLAQDRLIGILNGKILHAIDTSHELPDLSMFARYNIPRTHKDLKKLNATFSGWIGDLGEAVKIAEQLAISMAQVLSVIRKAEHEKEQSWIRDDDDAQVKAYIEHLVDTRDKLQAYLRETEAYFAFEQKCEALRSHFSGVEDVGVAVALSRIDRDPDFKVWFNDFMLFGPGYVVQEQNEHSILEFYKWALGALNKMTLARRDEPDALKHIDAAYRTIFLRLQVMGVEHDELVSLVQERQLAKNGMSNITEAYAHLAKSVGCVVANVTKCERPSLDGLFGLLSRFKSWAAANPFESEILVTEVIHAYRILAGSDATLLGQITQATQTVLDRRMAADFVHDALFGNYETLANPEMTLAPEIIALTHLAPALPYAASLVASGGIGSKAGKGAAWVASFALGPLPAVVVTLLDLFGRLAQTKVEKVLAKKLTSRADVMAILQGIMKWGRTGDVRVALKKAAVIYLARQGVKLVGSAWTDCRESRSDWVSQACKFAEMAAPAVAAPLYWYCTGDLGTALGTSGAMTCTYYCMRWMHRSKAPSTCARVDALVKKIAENMNMDASELEDEAKSSGTHGYDTMVASVAGDDANQRNEFEQLLNGLFSPNSFLPGGLTMLKWMVKPGLVGK